MVLAPSLHSLFITGISILCIFIIFITNFSKIMKSSYETKLKILSLMTIAIGIHGLIHLGVEREYGFNPYNWIST